MALMASRCSAVSPHGRTSQLMMSLRGVRSKASKLALWCRLRLSLRGAPLSAFSSRVRSVSSFVTEIIRPTVCLGVTYVVVYTYGCDDGRIWRTRCAVIDAALG